MKKLLTSILAISFAMPAMADITAQSTCDTNALGQSDNNSTANVEAAWTPIQYSEPAGQYLLFNNGTITQHTTCPAGSFCVGFSNQAFTDSSMGIQSCPTGYANSAAGATAQAQCYNPGTANCATRNPYTSGHGTAVYGNATNVSAETCKTYYGDTTTCVLDNANACDITALNCDTGYHQTGGSSPLASVDTSINGSDSGVKRHLSDFGDVEWRDKTSAYGLTESGAWGVTFPYGVVKGLSHCASTSGTYKEVADNITEDNNNYCWCKMTSYTPVNAGEMSAMSSWVFAQDLYMWGGDDDGCSYECAETCANEVTNHSDFRSVLMGTLPSVPLACTANTINIDWDPQNGESHTTNQCTYDGAITLPAEPSKTGYTFGGWRLKQN